MHFWNCSDFRGDLEEPVEKMLNLGCAVSVLVYACSRQLALAKVGKDDISYWCT